MLARLAAFAAILVLCPSLSANAQPHSRSIPLYAESVPRTIEPEPLPPVSAAPPPVASTPAPNAAPLPPPAERVFCGQPVAVRLVDPQSVPARYRSFIGMFSDAAWTPQLCAALIVENVTADGTATIVYAFGPMGANGRAPGGVLHGTGVIKDGELRFQNSDGSQFAFRPLYADLDGRLTTPKGQNYRAVFKKTQ